MTKENIKVELLDGEDLPHWLVSVEDLGTETPAYDQHGGRFKARVFKFQALAECVDYVIIDVEGKTEEDFQKSKEERLNEFLKYIKVKRMENKIND